MITFPPFQRDARLPTAEHELLLSTDNKTASIRIDLDLSGDRCTLGMEAITNNPSNPFRSVTGIEHQDNLATDVSVVQVDCGACFDSDRARPLKARPTA